MNFLVYIQKEPGIIVGPIAFILGIIINFIFNIVYFIVDGNSLGFTIILFTILIRFLMLPQARKQQRSMQKMQSMNPEIEKIKSKYSDKADPENKRKMQMEIQQLYSTNGVNPLAGCLPLLIQMPIFFALNYIMTNPYQYVDKLGEIYHQLATMIASIPNYLSFLQPLATAHVPAKQELMIYSPDPNMATLVIENIEKLLNVLSPSEWETVLASVQTLAPEMYTEFAALVEQKNAIESFFFINLTEQCGWAWPAIIIPILCVITTFLSTWLMQKGQINPSEQVRKTNKIMLISMPIIMGLCTVGLTAGVGIYWITSSTFQLIQQLFINKTVKRDYENRQKEQLEAKEKKQANFKNMKDPKNKKN